MVFSGGLESVLEATSFGIKGLDAVGCGRQTLYDPTDSTLVWTDTGEPLPLPAVFPRQDREWQPFWHAHHPTNPGGKSRDIRHLKLQLGLKCNYACQYCSQAHQPHDLDGHPSDVGPFMERLLDWFGWFQRVSLDLKAFHARYARGGSRNQPLHPAMIGRALVRAYARNGDVDLWRPSGRSCRLILRDLGMSSPPPPYSAEIWLVVIASNCVIVIALSWVVVRA